jgi:hypothetical protein
MASALVRPGDSRGPPLWDEFDAYIGDEVTGCMQTKQKLHLRHPVSLADGC